MYSLIKFDNQERVVIQTKQVKPIQENECIVKIKGSSYKAYILDSNDSIEILEKTNGDMEKHLEEVQNESTYPLCGYNKSPDQNENDVSSELIKKYEIHPPSSRGYNKSPDQNINDAINESNTNYKIHPPSPSGHHEVPYENINDKKSNYTDDNELEMAPSSDHARYSTPNKGTSCSTPLTNSPATVNSQLNDRTSTEFISTIESSAPSGATYIMDLIGDVSLNDSNGNLKKNTSFDTEICKEDMMKHQENIHDSTADNTCTNDTSIYEPSSSITTTNDKNNNKFSQKLVFPPRKNIAHPLNINEVHVPTSKTEDGKVPQKKHFCQYCKTLQTKIARHLELKHKDKAEVQEFLKYDALHPERLAIIAKIRNFGDYLHNTDASLNTGVIITCRRTQFKYNNNVEDYVCCSHCKGFFSKKTLRIHYKKCNPNYVCNQKDQLIKGKKLMGYMHSAANNMLRHKIFPSLRDGDVAKTLKYDKLLVLFGNKLCDTYTHEHQHDMIRSHLRLLGRLKIAVKVINKKITDFASIFHPRYYDAVIKAVKKVSEYNETKQAFETFYNPTTLGTNLKKCARIQAAECIKNGDFEGQKNVDNFMVLFDNDYSVTINKKAMEDRSNKNRNAKKIALPSKNDIQKLYKYAKDICDKAMETLADNFVLSAWKMLMEGTLILLQMFNRRRAGEVERLSLESYENRETIDKICNLNDFNKISKQSQQQANQFVRMVIRGKLGRTVPVLAHNFLVMYIEILIKYRAEAGVSSKNEFIFAVPRADSPQKSYIRACPIMRRFANECGASMPESLRGTMLRKHIATYTATLGIEENQVLDLANFMGHDKQIHKDVYRVPNGLVDMTEVSRLLQAAMGYNDEKEPINDENNDVPPENTSDKHNHIGTNDNFDADSEEIQPRKQWKRLRSCAASSDDEILNNSSNLSSSLRKRPTKRVRWSDTETNIIQTKFGDVRKMKKLPSLAQCRALIQKCPVLKKRTPQQLKTYIDNKRKEKARKNKNLIRE